MCYKISYVCIFLDQIFERSTQKAALIIFIGFNDKNKTQFIENSPFLSDWRNAHIFTEKSERPLVMEVALKRKALWPR
jgi:hypothetical protein